MAGRPKKGTAGLPEWFNIEEYACVKDFAALQWFQQLSVRRFIKDWCLDKDLQVYFQDGWQTAIKEDPILTEDSLREYYYQNNTNTGTPEDWLFASMSINDSLKHGVSAMTNGQVYKAFRSLPEKLVWDHDPPEYGEEHKQTSLYGEPFDSKNPNSLLDGHFVCVDLSLPDAMLVNEFKNYLRDQRKDAQKVHTSYLRSPDFSSWYNMGLLPYIDLKLIEQATGEGFLWSAFTNVLSTIADTPIGSESALQKTLKKSVARIDYQLIRILKAQAIKEESGACEKSGKLAMK